ncbi:MAG: sensor histidine kinase [Candidatus Cyclobacteriaceae bacterium M3_2C_046]
MINPITSQIKNFTIYFAFWLLIALLHAGIIHLLYKFSLSLAILEAVIFNLIFAGLGLGIWYVVAFNNIAVKDWLRLFIHHMLVAILLVGIWLWVSQMMIRGLVNNTNYLLFLQQTIYIRFFIGFLYYLSLLLVFYSITFYSSLQEKMINEQRLNTLVKEAELKNLRSQINPHFIFNSLNSISSLTLSAPEKARDMVIKLSDFLRYSLRQEHKTKTTSLKNELENIERYLAIEKVRFGSRLLIDQKVAPECLDQEIPFYLLQPLFENAIKYGVYESIAPVTIQMECYLEQQELVVKVQNSYDPETVTRKGEGLGLANIKSRLKAIYGRPDLINLTDDGSNFRVQIRVPQ